MMPESSKPVAKNTTPKSDFILDALRSQDAWMSRADIAAKMGKKVLNKWDMALLELLISQGLVQVEKRQVHGGIGFAWMYKAVRRDGK